MKYDDSTIMSLEGLSHIRFTPGMYGIDPDTDNGIFLQVKEILDNCIDEARIDRSSISDIEITFMRTNVGFQCIVKDSGRGVPLGMFTEAFTVPNTSGKWRGGYKTSTGIHGIGAKATVAMSRWFSAVTIRSGEGMKSLLVKEAKVVFEKAKKSKKIRNSGTVVFFEPDPKTMHNLEGFFEPDGPYRRLRELMEFVSIVEPIRFIVKEMDTTIDARKLKQDPETVLKILDTSKARTVAIYEHGSMDVVEYVCKKNRLGDVVWNGGPYIQEYIEIEDGSRSNSVINYKKLTRSFAFRVEVFTTTRNTTPVSIGSVNMIRIDNRQSIHIDTVYRCIKRMLHQLVEDKYRGFFIEFYKLPMHIASIVEWENARFVGQDKHLFTDRLFGATMEKYLIKKMKSTTQEEWENLYNAIKDDIVEKYNQRYRNEYGNSSDKNLAFQLNNPKCYYECLSNDKELTELIICEGTSAGDFVKQHRDNRTQAVFELTGKPKNAIKSEFNDSMRNKVFADLVKVLNTTPVDTNLDDLRFGKIVLLADADPDGYHISALLIGILHKINPKLLTTGRVIVASPPLYVISIGRKDLYVRDKQTMISFKAKCYRSLMDIDMVFDSGNTRRLLDDEYFVSFVHIVLNVGRTIDNLSKKLVIEPVILEQLAYVVDDLERGDYALISKKLGLTKCELEKSSNTLIMNIDKIDIFVPISGLVGEIRSKLLPVLDKLFYRHVHYEVTSKDTDWFKNEPMGIMEIYQLFKMVDKRYSLKRLKGLGELHEDQLKVTCLNRTTRTFCSVLKPSDVDYIFSLLGVDTKARKRIVSKNIS